MSTATTIEEQFRSTNSLIGDKVETKNGEVCGKCRDFVFDQKNWTIRYVVVDTGGFLSHNEVILSPFVFENPEFGFFREHMPTVLSKEWIEASPPVDSNAPISREYEAELARHYRYPIYWTGAGLWGIGSYPVAEIPDPEEKARHEEKMGEIADNRLRSCKEISGYEVYADSEEIGVVDDFIVQTGTWQIRYFVVDTARWLPGKKVVLSPDWAKEISWKDRRVNMSDMARIEVECAPPVDLSVGVNRDYEGQLYDYYGRRRYW